MNGTEFEFYLSAMEHEYLPALEREYLDESFHFIGAKELQSFHDWYKAYHGYLAAIVCTLGVLANTLTITVLTRKSMVSATNCILTGLAISDGMTMGAYLPFAFQFYIIYGTDELPDRNSLPAARFMLGYACFSVVVHTVSIWLTVTLATFRYVSIRHPRLGVTWCSLSRAKLAVFAVYLVSLIACLPNFATISIQGENVALLYPPNSTFTNQTAKFWNVRFKDRTSFERFLYSFNFWIQAILVKLVPCVVLTLLSFLLVKTMRRVDAKRQTLRVRSRRPDADFSSSKLERNRKTNRTTRMLLVVVLLFLLTELPQGIMNLMSGLCQNFVQEIYLNLGDLADILALTNNGINFILYCTMSKQFRKTFIGVLRK